MRSTILSAVAMATTVSAHAQVFGVWVNGEDQGDGRNTYIRSPDSNSPVKDLASPDIVCNVNGGKAVSDFVSVAAGDAFTFEWYHDNRNDDIIDGSHQGPIITYIAEYTEGDGTGARWSKIDEAGYDGSEWAVAKLIANGGKHDLTIPESLAAGKYIIRQEIIAHHESDTAFSENAARGAQFYPSCVQVEVTGSGSAVPDQDFDFNKGYTYQDPGIVFNLYSDYTTYDIPGPEVWSASSGGNSPAPSSPAETEAASTDAAAPTASSPAETGSAAPTASAPAESSPAASGTDAADPVATSSAEASSAPAPTASSPATTDAVSAPATTDAAPTTLATATRPASSSADESAAPLPTVDVPVEAPVDEGEVPVVGCKAKRRRSMKKRISAN